MNLRHVSTVRSVNRSTVLEIVKQHGPISRAGIARKFSMSRSAVSMIVDDLLAEGLVREGGIGESTPRGGRRSVNLEFVPTSKYAFGIDIGGTKTLFMLTDLSGNVIAREKISSHVQGMQPLEHIRSQADLFLTSTGVERSRIVGSGIGLPATIDHETGIVVNSPALRLRDTDARAFFAETLPGGVYVDNDVNMAVIGERWQGNGIGYRDVVLVAVGTGVGAGLLFGGRIHRGANGFAGEIGYFHTDPLVHDPQFSATEFGHLEALASGSGIRDQAKAMLATCSDSVLHGLEVTSEHVFDAARQGDKLAEEVIERTIKYLSFAISNTIAMLNPDVVLIGGGLSEAGLDFVEKIARRVTVMTPIPSRVIPAKLGGDAGAYGAAATALLATNNLEF